MNRERKTAWTAYLVSQFLIYSFRNFFLHKKTSCIELLNNKLLLRLFFCASVLLVPFVPSTGVKTSFPLFRLSSNNSQICCDNFNMCEMIYKVIRRNRKKKLKTKLDLWENYWKPWENHFCKLSLEFILMKSFSFISKNQRNADESCIEMYGNVGKVSPRYKDKLNSEKLEKHQNFSLIIFV